jgi:ABC-type glycerol-3-phosphate transport system substrate-binding protein
VETNRIGVSHTGQRLRRRQTLGAATGLTGIVLAACGQASGGTSGAGSSASGGTQTSPSKGPVTIEVITRPGVTSPTGHSQFYDARAKKVFTPETNITVNLVDAQPDVGEKLTTLAAGGSLPDASWFSIVADGSAGREQATKGIFKPLET